MLNKSAVIILLVIFAAGCGVETRTFVMTKPRVGLDRGNGNGGCVVGKCPPAPAPKETTRKIYVLELTKPVPESEVQKIETNAVNAITETSVTPAASQSAPAAGSPAASAPKAVSARVVPVVGELPGSAAPSASSPAVAEQASVSAQGGQTYTVQKDDTLQKISKKFFGTYGKWYKIYKANKNKIKNPNVLTPGLELTIPVIK
jgi:nucleoid-associated protein YgaU